MSKCINISGDPFAEFKCESTVYNGGCADDDYIDGTCRIYTECSTDHFRRERKWYGVCVEFFRYRGSFSLHYCFC